MVPFAFSFDFLDSDEDYNFEEDVKQQRALNVETRKRVRLMCIHSLPAQSVVQDKNFGANSVTAMNVDEILRSICCIEQTLLLNDDSPSIHNSGSELYEQSLDDIDVDLLVLFHSQRNNRSELLKVNPYLQSLYADIERYRLYNRAIDVRPFLAARDSNQVYRSYFIQEDDACRSRATASQLGMKRCKSFLEENEIPHDCVAINADIRLFNWSVGLAAGFSLASRLRPEVADRSSVRRGDDRPSMAAVVGQPVARSSDAGGLRSRWRSSTRCWTTRPSRRSLSRPSRPTDCCSCG